ncbi:catalase family peroxidase [Paraflavitalea sp. CAU 1676]|uniref:catalase family peroxidase n=1 Tax=Paraflavitalea sp. CAU 1676 TaxID=3032598 RepID=UPI0023DAA2D8|nr:catalase family peroxidase [Paraflavitalea sp. CAU 1676]MDF2191627.1 catalase family peroxidase [Paraflavitalea sp. CAU 1676]
MKSKLIVMQALVAGMMTMHAAAQTPPLQHTPADLVDALHTTFGKHQARAVHTKGIILEGTFTPAKEAASVTKAFHLQHTNSKVTIRFSDFTGIPDIPDNAGPANPRGLAIRFTTPDGNFTDIVGHSFNGFPTANSDQFRELLLSIAASGPGAAKPTALESFLATHPLAKTFLTTQRTPASYATITYFGVNSFKFTNSKDKSFFVRYQFIPEGGESILTPEQIAKADSNYLTKEITERVKKHPFRFKLYAVIAAPEDKIEDPSIAWPNTRKRVFLGTIEVNRLAANTTTEDKALAFNPRNIPDGIETADPMLDFRAKAYPISVKERQ